jgi:BirA family transcriptional regulator, biotin operon repressor / biotin---[acetyl-CoA-carboxylase] ligase
MESEDISLAVSHNLGTRFVGRNIIFYPRLSSTMTTARQLAQQQAVEGTVVIAGEQTQGKGRRNRTWLSPRGNVALSVILYPEVSQLPYLIMIASLAVVRSIETVTGLKPQIKWPNDILINGKKVCGILIENELRGNRASSVIGIGINIGLAASAYTEISDIATGLCAELGKDVSRVDIIRQLFVAMDNFYLSLSVNKESIFAEWRDRLVTLGKEVFVESDAARLEGIAESVDKDGVLLLRQADGTLTRVVAGDVTLRYKEKK